jgi:hypothetical protein
VPGRSRRATGLVAGIAGAAIAATLLAACGTSDASDRAPASSTTSTHATAGHDAVNPDKQVALYTAMRQLWGQHMEWTYATVDAFFHNQKALTPTLNRLLANQRDIGAAIAPYYGKDAGDQLTKLLTTHINEAVPVLQAAQAGDKPKLDRALATWYANAKDVADFLSAANPDNWPQSATEPMLKAHISQTTAYAVDLLKGDYAKSIKDYDEAERHMLMLADVLAKGVLAQFPQQFS